MENEKIKITINVPKADTMENEKNNIKKGVSV